MSNQTGPELLQLALERRGAHFLRVCVNIAHPHGHTSPATSDAQRPLDASSTQLHFIIMAACSPSRGGYYRLLGAEGAAKATSTHETRLLRCARVIWFNWIFCVFMYSQ